MYLGEALPDPERFIAADKYFQDAINFSRGLRFNFEAALLGVQSLVAAGNFDEAFDRMKGLIQFMEYKKEKEGLNEEDSDLLGECLYFQGIIHLLRESLVEDVQECVKKLTQIRPGHRRIETLGELFRLQSSKKSRLFIILVGIDEYQFGQLSGAKNDVHAIEEALGKRWRGIGEFQLIKLIDHEATKDRIESAFQEVAREAQPLDSFFFHFSGMGGLFNPGDRGQEDDKVIFPFDCIMRGEKLEGSIQAELFHSLMKSIPCIQKFASLDTAASHRLVTLSKEEPLYNLMYATDAGNRSYEVTIEGRRYGVFSKSIADALEISSGQTFWEDVLNNVRQYRLDQEPVLIGETGFFFEAAPYSFPIMLKKVFVLAEKPTLSDIRLLERFFFRIPHFPELHLRLIKLFAKYNRHDYVQAQINKMESLQPLPGAILPTAIQSSFIKKNHTKAIALIQELNKENKDGYFEKLINQYAELMQVPAYALLIGIDSIPQVSGKKPLCASEDAREMEEALKDVFGMKAENITVLLNEQASNTRIFSEFHKLMEKTIHSPVLLYCAGFGTILPESFLLSSGSKGISGMESETNNPEIPGFFSADGFAIPFQQLQGLSGIGNPKNIYAVFDVGLSDKADRFQEFSGDTAVQAIAKGIGWIKYRLNIFAKNKGIPVIGTFTALPAYHNISDGWVSGCFEEESGGVFTNVLISTLKEMPKSVFKVSEWIKALKMAEVRHENLIFNILNQNDKLFLQPDPSLEIEMRPVWEFFLRRAREVLSRFESNEPSALIELAYVQHLLGDSDDAVHTLENLQKKFPEKIPIHFPLGRILTESAGGDKDKWSYAINKLRESHRSNTIPPYVCYYLGKALLGLIHSEKETEAEELFRQYAAAGYPLGHREEVEAYLNSRDPEKQIRTLLLKARNLEREEKVPEALEALEKAASLGSSKALEEKVRICALLDEWEKVMAAGVSLMKSGKGSEAFPMEFAKLIPKALSNPYYVKLLKETLDQADVESDNSELMSWLKDYRKLIKKYPFFDYTHQNPPSQ